MNKTYYEFYFPNSELINAAVISGYLGKLETDAVRKTHLFDGRYENIYIDREEIPALANLISFWLSSAGEVLSRRAADLRCGFWFNDMQPGDVTQPHSHDDDDELLSGVYYLDVPEHSGKLIMHTEDGKITIKPEAGKLVLFSSSGTHEVTQNQSQSRRLSIGINFGCPSCGDGDSQA